MSLYRSLLEAAEQRATLFSVLIDPDGAKADKLDELLDLASTAKVDMFFVGGSLISDNRLEECLDRIKLKSASPVVLFPGSTLQFHPKADAILFLSLISGRNPDLLIGRHVEIAPALKSSGIEVISTGYMLIDGGVTTSALYMSNTYPIPANKTDIAVATAIAGEMLGLKLLYMDAGSGARQPVSPEMIRAVKEAVQIPLIVGGGIRTPEQAKIAAAAGADMIVVGNILEKHPERITEF